MFLFFIEVFVKEAEFEESTEIICVNQNDLCWALTQELYITTTLALCSPQITFIQQWDSTLSRGGFGKVGTLW